MRAAEKGDLPLARLVGRSGALALVLCAAGCSPEPSDGVPPEVALSQVGRESVAVIASSVPETQASVPVPTCAGGGSPAAAIAGTGGVWEVAAFPVELLVTAADPASVDRLELTVEGGVLDSPEPPSVEITGATVDGRPVQRAEIPAGYRRGRPVRWFHVSLGLAPGHELARLAVAARDGGGVEAAPVRVVVGTRDALCAGPELP